MGAFAPEVRQFNVQGLPMIVHCGNGCVIGLTEEAAARCAAFESGDYTERDLEVSQPSLFTALQQYGFLSHGVSPEEETFRSAYLHVTDRCDLNCVGCYSASAQRNRLDDLSFEQICTIIDRLIELGVVELNLSGGEPGLRNDLCDIAEYARTAGVTYLDVATNGAVANNGLDLPRLATAVDGVVVSIDGIPGECPSLIRGGGSCSIAIDAVKRLKADGVPVSLLPTIHAQNIEDIPAYMELAKSLEVPINFSMLSCSACNTHLGNLAFDEDTLVHLARQLRTLWQQKSQDGAPPLSARLCCGAGRSELSVAADGKVYPCHMLHDAQYYMGNLLENSPEEILASPVRDAFCSLSVEQFEECSECEIRYLCGGGCRARAVIADGIEARDPYCALMKEHFRDIVKDLIGNMKG